jgi:hypothetical protein
MSQRAKNLIIICLAMLASSVFILTFSPNWAITLCIGYLIGLFAGASIESERAK